MATSARKNRATERLLPQAGAVLRDRAGLAMLHIESALFLRCGGGVESPGTGVLLRRRLPGDPSVPHRYLLVGVQRYGSHRCPEQRQWLLALRQARRGGDGSLLPRRLLVRDQAV